MVVYDKCVMVHDIIDYKIFFDNKCDEVSFVIKIFIRLLFCDISNWIDLNSWLGCYMMCYSTVEDPHPKIPMIHTSSFH